MPTMDATTQAVVIQTAFFALSVGGAWIVLVILKGTARIRHKGAQFGGAAAMFVAMFLLLNRYVPEMRDGIIAEAHAAQKVVSKNERGSVESFDVYLAPDRQIVNARELRTLDKNRYVVEEELGMAALRPPGGWLVGRLESFDRISMADLPIIKFGLDAVRSVHSERDAAPIFGIRDQKVQKIVVGKDSEIGGVLVRTNPFEDERFVRTMVENQIEMTKSLGLLPSEIDKPEQKKELVDTMIGMMSGMLNSSFAQYVDKAFPLERRIQNGVYVSIYESATLPSNLFLEKLIKGMPLLDRAINTLALKGYMMGAGRNLKIDQKRGVASFDGSMRLKNVALNDSKSDVTLNDIGFIVVGDNRIVFVQLICLDIDGFQTSLVLKQIMDSLLFVN